tara:strand:+ start:547 stop:2070 length:1524 start_codon:yes stop_codon:yes gene_type:complete
MPTTISGSGSADFHTALPVAEGGTGATASTGSGNVVLSASPTLTGTVTTAALNTTGNVGIGTAAPAQKLHVALAGRVGLQVEATTTDIAEVLLKNTTETWGIKNEGGNLVIADESTGIMATMAKDTGVLTLAAGVKEVGFSATGGSITKSGDYTIHTFNGSGTFTPNSAGNVDYLIVAGGGAGGNWHAGGGGAGGVLTAASLSVTAQGYPIVIGEGGTGGTSSLGNNGGNSTAFGLTAIGGGRGGNYSATPPASGGSGGGGNGVATSAHNTGAAGTAGQGNAGGNAASAHGGGGGGGAGAVGGSTGNTDGAAGGVGVANSYSGSSVYYGGGGGGGSWQNTSTGGIGGNGGGGNGSYNLNTNPPTQGTANTGGGGGGAGSQGNNTSYVGQTTGGSGVVIIRYLTVARADLTVNNTDIGVDQSWIDVSSSRAANISYTNTTGKPIQVNVWGGGGNGLVVTLTVGAVLVATNGGDGAVSYHDCFVSAIVPAGATYIVQNNGNSLNWAELR